MGEFAVGQVVVGDNRSHCCGMLVKILGQRKSDFSDHILLKVSPLEYPDEVGEYFSYRFDPLPIVPIEDLL